MVQDRRRTKSTTTKTTVKLDPEVHALLTLVAEKYKTTLSGAIHKLITEYKPEIVTLYNEIEALKKKHLRGDT